MPATPPLWLAPHADRLSIFTLDTLTAVYDRASGQTHILAQPLPEILAALRDSGANAQAIADRLSATFDIADSGDLHARIAECLNELAALGLVERA
ncbi:MAG: HPr-rel-A system PqqD family peptide chaperone [Pseudomonadota bacterium]